MIPAITRIFGKSGLMVLPLLLGLLFFAASLTPSLIPRDSLLQGGLGGLVMALGYLLGRGLVSLWRLMELPALRRRMAVTIQAACAVPVLLLVAICLGKAGQWQDSIRSRMGMEPVDSLNTLQMLLLALAIFCVLVLLGYSLQWVFDRIRNRLDRFMPRRTANVIGFLVTLLLVLFVTRDGVLDRMITSIDKSYRVGQALFDTAPPRPTNPMVVGAEGSLVEWGAMGQPGRDFVTLGPDAGDISAFTGREALRPIRVYVGLAQADTPEERAKIALAELIRLGGFDREILIVAMPTGTGWLDPGSHDPVEYMHNGDIATVAAQYSYLQSPLALILDTRSGLDQAKALVSSVHTYWRNLPAESRPRLYIHGLSLGAWSSMHGTDLFALLDDPIDGAFWAGPPFPSTLWQIIVAERNQDSPYVMPTIGDGRLVRFASHIQGAGGPDGWGRDMRLMFLQYPSDPIVFYEPASLFRPPTWMNEPPAEDVSPSLIFIPVVTQFQLAVDMAVAGSAPPGYGHAYYAHDYIGPWVAVTAPANWTQADTARLIAHCDVGFELGCEND